MIDSLVLKILELFVYLILGFVLAKSKIVDVGQSVILSKLSLYVLLPAAIINAFDMELTADIAIGCAVSLCAAVMIHFALLIIDRIYRWGVSADPVERASVMYSNAGNLVIPLVTAILGEEWVLYCVPFLAVQILFLWTHGLRLFSDGRVSVRKTLTNPNMIAVAVGVAVLLFGGLPDFAGNITGTLSNMLAPIGMIIAGLLFSEVKVKDLFLDIRVYRVLLMRLIVCPVVVLGLLKCLSVLRVNGIDNILLISLIASVTPTASTVMQFAQIHKRDATFALCANIASTILCVITIPLLTMLYLL